MSACDICGAACTFMTHEFHEGLAYKSWRASYPILPWRPRIIASYQAPLYHHPVTHAPYCSPECATAGMTAAPDASKARASQRATP